MNGGAIRGMDCPECSKNCVFEIMLIIGGTLLANVIFLPEKRNMTAIRKILTFQTRNYEFYFSER